MIINNFNFQDPSNQRFIMEYDPKSLILRNFLQLLSCWLAFLIWIRFFTDLFAERNEALQMFAAIMATVVPMLEKMGEGRIASPEAYIWTRSFISSIKGMLMVTVFVINGLANDFFIGCFFYITTSIGFIYFSINPYQDPDSMKQLHQAQEIMESNIRQIQIRVKKEVYA